MKCHILFSGKKRKNISKCRLLKILPRVLSVKVNAVSSGYVLNNAEPGKTVLSHLILRPACTNT